MERIEPILIPQWLKGTGNGSMGLHQTSSSSLSSDDHTTHKHARNRHANVNGHDLGRSYSSDRTTSSHFRRSSSSNGSIRRAQSSFAASSGDKYDSKEKDKSNLGDFRRYDYSDPFDNILPIRLDKDLRRSQSLIIGKQSEASPNNKSNHGNSDGMVSVSCLVKTVQKTAFERDFPSLGADERQSASELRRVSSPGFMTTAIQTLPVGNSTILGGDGWTSALAEAPVQQSITSTVSSITPNAIGVLNMAETVANGHSRANNIAQLPVGNQKLEELVLKQSRQLIPVISTMSKNSVLNPSDKAKGKTSQPQQNPSSLTNLSPRANAGKSDFHRPSMVGKLQVLKPSRERNNGPVPLTTKEPSTPNDNKVVSSSSVAPLPSPLRCPGRPVPPILEKRLTQARSRNDFFNLVRKNSISATPSSVGIETSPPQVVGQSEKINSPALDISIPKKADDDNNNDEKTLSHVDTILYSEEEEAAFLRSLGWEEKNNGEDEGLTEEEIRAFYKHANEYIKQKPTSKTSQKIQPKLFGPQNSRPDS